MLSWRPDRRQVRIGPGQAAYVEVHQNANPGWRATLDGRRLAPARLDGWQQAYLVPAGAGGVITMTFTPATLYHAGLAGSALAVLILLVAALPWKRRRRAAAAGPPDDGPAAGTAGPTNGAPAGEAGAAGATGRTDGAADGPVVSTPAAPANGTPAGALGPRHAAGAMRRGSGLRRWAGPLAVAALIVAVGGPVALAVPVLAVIALLRPRALPAISLAAMLAAGAIAATAVAPAATGSGAFGPAAQVLALVALAAALYPAGAGALDARDGWRPSRPLPGLGRRLMLPPGPGGQPEPPAGQAGPLSIGGPPVTTVPFGLADELSCYYDTPAEPCNVHVEVRVPGHLDEPALRRAAHAALAAQPRAVARRAQGGRWQRRYAWELPAHLDTDPVSAATWTDEGDLAQQRMRFLAAAPPLEQSPPLRLLLAAGPGEARVILNAHHAALDGISCLELLRAVAAHYPAAGDIGAPGPRAGAMLAAPIPARPTDPDATGTCSAVQATSPAPGSHGGAPGPAARFHDPGLKLAWRGTGRWVGGFSPGSWKVSGSQRPDRAGRPGLLPRPAARIAADRRAGPGRPEPNPRSGYGFKLVTFPRVPAFPEAGREPRVTVNDLLIARADRGHRPLERRARAAVGPDPDHDAGQLPAGRRRRSRGQPVPAHRGHRSAARPRLRAAIGYRGRGATDPPGQAAHPGPRSIR